MNQPPHTPHFDRSENRYRGCLTNPTLHARVIARRVALSRAVRNASEFVACYPDSLTLGSLVHCCRLL